MTEEKTRQAGTIPIRLCDGSLFHVFLPPRHLRGQTAPDPESDLQARRWIEALSAMVPRQTVVKHVLKTPPNMHNGEKVKSDDKRKRKD